MNQLHPRRYPEAFRGQLQRLERLAPGITTSSADFQPDTLLMEIEQTGITDDEMVSAQTRLNHLERLIADWRIDGENSFEVAFGFNPDVISIEFSEVPPTVTYVQFTESPALALQEIKDLRIEGVYMREVVAHGAFSVELTFVCHEPGWKTMDCCLYADAVKVGSRACVGSIPLGLTHPVSNMIERFEGDPRILDEPALAYALLCASDFAASRPWSGYKF